MSDTKELKSSDFRNMHESMVLIKSDLENSLRRINRSIERFKSRAEVLPSRQTDAEVERRIEDESHSRYSGDQFAVQLGRSDFKSGVHFALDLKREIHRAEMLAEVLGQIREYYPGSIADWLESKFSKKGSGE